MNDLPVPATPLEQAAAEAEAPDLDAQSEISGTVVFVASSVTEGQIVADTLMDAGIEAVFNYVGSPAMGEVFTVAEGQAGEVVVRSNDADAARVVLEAYENYAPAIED